MLSTPGRLMIEKALPVGMRGRDREWTTSGVRSFFDELARTMPDHYKSTAQRLARLGADLAYNEGGLSFGVDALLPSPGGVRARERAAAEADAALHRATLTPEERRALLIQIAEKHAPLVTAATYDESLAAGNPLAEQVKSGLKGSKSNVNSLRGADILYNDHEGKPVPFLVLRNYSEGLDPAEYWAAASGARSGVVGVKLGVAQSGWLAKQMLRAAHRLVVTARDAPEERPDAAERGLPVDVSDADNEGALLARPAGGLPRNTILTPHALRQLSAAGVQRILVRSPLVGGPPDGGVYGRDVGVREKASIADIDDYVGITAAQALGERATQLSLSSKHSGGVAGSSSGLSGLDDLLNPPQGAARAAVHARTAGRVGAVAMTGENPYIEIEGVRHSYPIERSPVVRSGDVVAAGDRLTDGAPDMKAIVEHQGLGAGRLALLRNMRDVYKGMRVDRRNIELVARGVVDHVKVDELFGPHLPGDVIAYSSIEDGWRPRPGHVVSAPHDAIGSYLEKPVLHYAVGDPITRSMADDVKSWGIDRITSHPDKPPFHAVFLPTRGASVHDPDPFVRHLGAGATRGTMEAVHRSRSSPAGSTSFVARMLRPDEFGVTDGRRGRLNERT